MSSCWWAHCTSTTGCSSQIDARLIASSASRSAASWDVPGSKQFIRRIYVTKATASSGESIPGALSGINVKIVS